MWEELEQESEQLEQLSLAYAISPSEREAVDPEGRLLKVIFLLGCGVVTK